MGAAEGRKSRNRAAGGRRCAAARDRVRRGPAAPGTLVPDAPWRLRPPRCHLPSGARAVLLRPHTLTVPLAGGPQRGLPVRTASIPPPSGIMASRPLSSANAFGMSPGTLFQSAPAASASSGNVLETHHLRSAESVSAF
ncbi:uncharacterized protein LOC117999056 [Mirounga leonina]|uniref:uncharacterized protein LOC117999056 n=1 Tax=Mirounga leonina TaxID=9715 RepID=UPI00156C3F58|nr:uncharacterized protein LOC117999056 [Mirounga leonina]